MVSYTNLKKLSKKGSYTISWLAGWLAGWLKMVYVLRIAVKSFLRKFVIYNYNILNYNFKKFASY